MRHRAATSGCTRGSPGRARRPAPGRKDTLPRKTPSATAPSTSLRKWQSRPLRGFESVVENQDEALAVVRLRYTFGFETGIVAKQHRGGRTRLEPVDAAAAIRGHVLGRVGAQHEGAVGEARDVRDAAADHALRALHA